MSFPDRNYCPLIVVFLKVDHTLDSPVNSKSTFENEPTVDFSRFYLETFIVVKLIVGFELQLDLSFRDVWTR